MSEMPRTESFQQATQITDEISKKDTPASSRGKLRRIALVRSVRYRTYGRFALNYASTVTGPPMTDTRR